jgi:hypothetical protein
MQMTRLLVHMDAAYSLARWLTRNELDAEDVVQDAYLRAFSYLASFRGATREPGCSLLCGTLITAGVSRIEYTNRWTPSMRNSIV